MSSTVADKVIESFIGKVNAFLSMYNVCFVGGAFVFEDPDAKLYNLLTYNKLTVSDDKCHSDDYLSRYVSHKQSKTHGVFLQKFEPVKCVPKITVNLPGCKEGRCIKFERQIELHHICDVCKSDSQRNNDEAQTKRVILYYPFLDKATNKRYLYVKLESHRMISTGHIVEASKTYIAKTKVAERREKDPYTGQLQDADALFYGKMAEYFGINAGSLAQYNSSLRSGAEFFVSKDLLDMFLDIFLDRTPISTVCTNPALNPVALKSKTLSNTRSKSKSKSKSKSRSNRSHLSKISEESYETVSSSKSKSNRTNSKLRTTRKSTLKKSKSKGKIRKTRSLRAKMTISKTINR